MINIYDFDGTIYDGDSSIDFMKFCFKKNKKVIISMLNTMFVAVLYFVKIKSKENFKESFFSFVKFFEDIDKIVEEFWVENEYKIKKIYLLMKKNTDVIVSASPEFLLKPLTDKYGIKVIATKVNKYDGEIFGKNCYGKEKVERLKQEGIRRCNKFYSDSFSDEPLKNISKNAYIVEKNNIIRWEDYKENFIKKFKRNYFNPDFITFVLIGCINALNGIWISYVYSLVIKSAILAYVFGFLTSVIISYILNSVFNFKERIRFAKMVNFIINNIPNFIIQVLSVIIFLRIIKFSKIVSYSISAVIAVPITFYLIKKNVFKEVND